jgi:hypothetical protein
MCRVKEGFESLPSGNGEGNFMSSEDPFKSGMYFDKNSGHHKMI